MRQKKLFLMALTLLMMIPLGAWAEKTGCLFVNNDNTYTTFLSNK